VGSQHAKRNKSDAWRFGVPRPEPVGGWSALVSPGGRTTKPSSGFRRASPEAGPTGTAVKIWDWHRVRTQKASENRWSRRCLSQFLHSLGAKSGKTGRPTIWDGGTRCPAKVGRRACHAAPAEHMPIMANCPADATSTKRDRGCPSSCFETDGWLPRVFALFRKFPFGTAGGLAGLLQHDFVEKWYFKQDVFTSQNCQQT
jgi:hypothetical protein